MSAIKNTTSNESIIDLCTSILNVCLSRLKKCIDNEQSTVESIAAAKKDLAEARVWVAEAEIKVAEDEVKVAKQEGNELAISKALLKLAKLERDVALLQIKKNPHLVDSFKTELAGVSTAQTRYDAALSASLLQPKVKSPSPLSSIEGRIYKPILQCRANLASCSSDDVAKDPQVWAQIQSVSDSAYRFTGVPEDESIRNSSKPAALSPLLVEPAFRTYLQAIHRGTFEKGMMAHAGKLMRDASKTGNEGNRKSLMLIRLGDALGGLNMQPKFSITLPNSDGAADAAWNVNIGRGLNTEAKVPSSTPSENNSIHSSSSDEPPRKLARQSADEGSFAPRNQQLSRFANFRIPYVLVEVKHGNGVALHQAVVNYARLMFDDNGTELRDFPLWKLGFCFPMLFLLIEEYTLSVYGSYVCERGVVTENMGSFSLLQSQFGTQHLLAVALTAIKQCMQQLLHTYECAIKQVIPGLNDEPAPLPDTVFPTRSSWAELSDIGQHFGSYEIVLPVWNRIHSHVFRCKLKKTQTRSVEGQVQVEDGEQALPTHAVLKLSGHATEESVLRGSWRRLEEVSIAPKLIDIATVATAPGVRQAADDIHTPPGWRLTLSEWLGEEDGWMTLYDASSKNMKASQWCMLRQAVEKAMRRMHAMGIVHGDLRATNIMVRFLYVVATGTGTGTWEVGFIDLEWSGPVGIAHYSPSMASIAEGVPRHRKALPGAIIEVAHDVEQLRLVFEEECGDHPVLEG